MIKLFKLPLLLILVIIFALFFGSFVPYSVKSFLYATSLTIKELLTFILPFIIFSLVFNSINDLQGNKAIRLIIMLVLLICISNLVSVVVAYIIGAEVLSLGSNFIKIESYEAKHVLHPSWNIRLPVIIKNSYALLSGFIASMALSKLVYKSSKKISSNLLKVSMFILKKLFIPVVPIFILGFALKMQEEQVIRVIFSNYLIILLIVFLVTYIYILSLYTIGSGFKRKILVSHISNIFPAALLSLSTMSSLVAMPMTLLANEKNTDKNTARLVTPVSVNIHLVGDCFFIIILALTILYSFNGSINVSLYQNFNFFLYFVLLIFAVAAVPGGGVVVMLPTLEQYLHFSPVMLSIITTLYIIFDPIITSANVMGNGAFTIIFHKICGKFFVKKEL